MPDGWMNDLVYLLSSSLPYSPVFPNICLLNWFLWKLLLLVFHTIIGEVSIQIYFQKIRKIKMCPSNHYFYYSYANFRSLFIEINSWWRWFSSRVPLNHHRRRGHNKMMSLKEQKSNLTLENCNVTVSPFHLLSGRKRVMNNTRNITKHKTFFAIFWLF